MAADDEKRDNITWRQATTMIGLALGIPWLIGGSAFIGWYLDRRYDTWPLWFLIFLFIGLLATALDIYKLLKRFGQFK